MPPDDSPFRPLDAGRVSRSGSYLRAGAADVAASLRYLPHRLRSDPTLSLVLALTAVALLARLVDLGARVAHFDEGRVAFWALQVNEIGFFQYRSAIHGPFVPHASAKAFALLGPTDVSMRLVVALVGGLLPLSALLFRDRLRDAEVVALALLLALNPVLLYYSRYMRSDVPVAAFMLVSLGLLVRAYDRSSPRALYAAAAFAALGFASKENAVVYVVSWAGAGALVAYGTVVRRRTEGSVAEAATDQFDRHVRPLVPWLAADSGAPRARLWGAARPAAGAVAVFLVVFGLFYAPRGGSYAEVGVWRSLTHPTMMPDVLRMTYVDPVVDAGRHWVGGSADAKCSQTTVFGCYGVFARDFLSVLAKGAGALVALAVGGYVVERYWSVDPRPLVLGATYWGAASVVGYPLAADIRSAWVTIHAIVPLAVPAAVALALVVRWGREARVDGDAAGLALSVLLVGFVVGSMALTGVQTSYVAPQSHDNFMVQYAQPSTDVRQPLRDARSTFDANEGTDVLYYGDLYYVANEDRVTDPPLGAPGPWYERLPLPWYTAAYGADVSSARAPAQLEAALGDDPPPVLVVERSDREVVDRRVEGYVATVHDLRGAPQPQEVVVYVDESLVTE